MARKGIGPMQFGSSNLRWGGAASPAAYAMGAAYGRLPRSTASGTSGKGLRRILAPWGNAVGLKGPKLKLHTGGGRRVPTPDPLLFAIPYPANDPRRWPIEGGKIVIFQQAAKANRHNAIVNHAFVRSGYPSYSSPTYSGSDASYAEQ